MMNDDDIVYRLRKRAEIRRSIPRGEPDRISDILEEAAREIVSLRVDYIVLKRGYDHVCEAL